MPRLPKGEMELDTEIRPLMDIEPGTVVESPDKTQGVFTGLQPDHKHMREEHVLARVYRHNTQPVATRMYPSTLDLPWTIIRGKEADKVMDSAKAQIKKDPSIAIQDLAMNVGGDPEIFMTHVDGKIFPAWEFLQDKYSRERIYWDGFQAEIASIPSHCIESYTSNLRWFLYQLHQRASDSLRREVKFSPESAIEVPQETLNEADEKHIAFGCSPSTNIYGDVGMPPLPPRFQTLRTAGGHLHFGLPRQSRTNLIHIAYALDGIVGVAGVSLAEGLDRAERRLTYGRAGEIRFPKHGLEYRVLSNFHLLHPALTHLVYELARTTVRFGASGFYSMLYTGSQDEVRRVINENDVPGARKLLKDNQDLIMVLLSKCNWTYAPANATKKAWYAILHGIRSVMPTVEDVFTNWELKTERLEYYQTWSTFARALSVKGEAR